MKFESLTSWVLLGPFMLIRVWTCCCGTLWINHGVSLPPRRDHLPCRLPLPALSAARPAAAAAAQLRETAIPVIPTQALLGTHIGNLGLRTRNENFSEETFPWCLWRKLYTKRPYFKFTLTARLSTRGLQWSYIRMPSAVISYPIWFNRSRPVWLCPSSEGQKHGRK